LKHLENSRKCKKSGGERIRTWFQEKQNGNFPEGSQGCVSKE